MDNCYNLIIINQRRKILKKVGYIFFAVLTAISLVACNKDEEVPTIKKPEQELMFLLKHDNWSEEEIHSAMQLSENDNSESTILKDEFAVMYDFVNNADIPNVPIFKEYAEAVYDVGFDTLYSLEQETDGSYTQHKLCVSGKK